MKRSEQREEIFKLLFRQSFYDDAEFIRQVDEFSSINESILTEDDISYIVRKVKSIFKYKEKIDELIAQNTKGWKIERLSKVVLSILRLGIFEILYDDDIPNKVAINEAVDIAKKYADENAFGFVNALLGKILNE